MKKKNVETVMAQEWRIALWNMVVHVPNTALLAEETRRLSALTVTEPVGKNRGKFKKVNNY